MRPPHLAGAGGLYLVGGAPVPFEGFKSCLPPWAFGGALELCPPPRAGMGLCLFWGALSLFGGSLELCPHPGQDGGLCPFARPPLPCPWGGGLSGDTPFSLRLSLL